MNSDVNGRITVENENHEAITIQVLYTFDNEENKKRYVVYTPDINNKKNTVNILISELDYDTYELKDIDEDEVEMVMQYYKASKEELLNS